LLGGPGGKAGKCSVLGKQRDNASLFKAVGRITAGMMKDEKQGGRSTPRCGGVAMGAAGRRPTE